MLNDFYVVEETPIPKSLTSDKALAWAQELGDDFECYKKARATLDTMIIPECDRAFMAIKQDTTIEAIKQVDNGMLGDATLRTAVKSYRNEILAQLNPPNEAWLTAASMEDEDDDEDTAESIKDMMIRLCLEARVFPTLAPTIDQLLVRGITAMGVRWEKKRVLRKIDPQLAETIGEIGEMMTAMNLPSDTTTLGDQLGMDIGAGEAAQEEGKPPEPMTRAKAKKIKVWKDYYAQPVTYPIDIYHLYFDPTAEMTPGCDVPYVYITFKSLSDLKNARDPETNELLYDKKALKSVNEISYMDYFKEFPEACAASKLMGIDPTLEESGSFVPVYVFYKLERDFEDGSTFIDKFFYVTKGDSGWVIIRIQDNPSEFGDKPFYFTTCDQWLNLPIGSGIVEKSLSTFKAKNLMADLGLVSACLNVLPPMWYFTGVVKDDKKPSMKIGGMQAISFRPGIGQNWVGPMPVNPNGLMISMQDERALGEKMIDQTGITTVGVRSSGQNRTGKKERTATEIRQEASEGMIGQQYMVEKITQDLLQPSAQTIYNGARTNYSEGYKFITRTPTGEVKSVHLEAMEIDKERQIEIIGKRAMDNKAHMMDNLMKALEILMNKNAAGILGPSFALMAHDILIKILSRLAIPMKPEYEQSPQEIMAGNPQAQLEMLQAALQIPEGMQMAAEVLLNSPEGQQFIQELMAGAGKAQPQGGNPNA